MTDELTPKQQDKLRRRDKKRITPMVVDGASIRRTAMAIEKRNQEEKAK